MSTGIQNPYIGYTIFQFNPSTEADVKTLQDLEEERNDGVIFLTRSIFAEIGKATDIMVKPALKEEFVVKLQERGLTPKSSFTVRNSHTELRQRTDKSREKVHQ